MMNTIYDFILKIVLNNDPDTMKEKNEASETLGKGNNSLTWFKVDINCDLQSMFDILLFSLKAAKWLRFVGTQVYIWKW